MEKFKYLTIIQVIIYELYFMHFPTAVVQFQNFQLRLKDGLVRQSEIKNQAVFF